MYIEPYHDERELPEFKLREIDLPEVKMWEVNDEYYLLMKVEMVGKNNRSDLPEKQDKMKLEGSFKVKSVRPIGDEPVDVKALEKQDFERTLAKVKSGDY